MSKKAAGKKDLSSKLAGAVRAAKTEYGAQEEVVAPDVLPPVPYREEHQRRVLPISQEAGRRERLTPEAKVAKPQVARLRARQSGQVQSPSGGAYLAGLMRHFSHPSRCIPVSAGMTFLE